MSAGTIEQMVRHLITRWGLRKVRLTGGEPTARRDLFEIIERLSRIDSVDDLTMTTNGLTLPQHAAAFRRAKRSSTTSTHSACRFGVPS